MKKYVLFLLTILVILGTTLITNMIMINNNINKSFSDSGYILKNSDNSERYYFTGDSTFKNSYNDQIVFKDTEGEKIVVNKYNFIHYENGSISSFTKGVLLDLNTIDTEPITYYNISANKVLKKLSNNSYVIKNLDKELQFSNIMWRIAPSKYLVASDNITIIFADGTEKQISGFLEIEYFDNEIVKIFNQEVIYETISSDMYLKIGDNIKINLGTKIISKNDVNEMTLENMVIDSNDNVTIIDMNEYKEEEKENEEENEEQESTQSNGTNSGNVSGIQGGNSGAVSNGDSVANGGNTDNKQENNKNENNDVEIEIEDDLSVYAPKFVVKEFEVSSTRMTCSVNIEDEESRLVQDITVEILDNMTGKPIEGGSFLEPLGKYSIDVDINTLNPDKEYTLVMKSVYKIDETEYTKNFVYKFFRTPILGMSLSKDIFTEDSLSFNIDFESDSKIKSVDVILEDPEGVEETQKREKIQNDLGKQKKVTFTDLTPNKEYIIKIANVSLLDAPIQSYKTYNYKYKTLKKLYEFEDGETNTELVIQKDERESKFTLSIPGFRAEEANIETFNYEIYTLTDDGIENIVDNRIVSATEITLNVDGEKIRREQNYFARVYGTLYDNEKTVEYLVASTTNCFVMDTRAFPTVRFEPGNITWESIEGRIVIEDTHNTIVMDETVRVEVTNNFGEMAYSLNTNISSNSIEIPLQRINNLRKNTTYKIAVFATIDIDDNEPIENYCIGYAIVNTRNDAEINAEWTENSNEVSNQVSLRLRSARQENDINVDLAAQTLTKMRINLYEGEGIGTSNPIASYEFIDGNIDHYNSELKERFYDSSYIIVNQNNVFLSEELQTPIQLNNDTTYTLEISNLYDYTTNNNENGTQGNVIEVLENNIRVFETGRALPQNPDESEDFLTVEEITKEELSRNVEIYSQSVSEEERTEINNIIDDSSINNDTVVAIRMRTINSQGILGLGGNITYYVYDNEGYAYDQSRQQAIENSIFQIEKPISTQIDEIPFALMLLDNAEDVLNDINTRRRGKRYYFTCEITTESGNRYPIATNNDDYNWWSSQNEISILPEKQEAIITMFPSFSDNSSHTFKYLITDIDNAMVSGFNCYVKNSNETNFTRGSVIHLNELRENTSQYESVTFQNLSDLNDAELEIRTRESKYDGDNQPERILIHEEGMNSGISFDENDFTYNVNTVDNLEQSKILLQITPDESVEIENIAKIDINFKNEGEIVSIISKDKEGISNENNGNLSGTWNIGIFYNDIVENKLPQIQDSLLGQTLDISINVYYIDGNTGFDAISDNGLAVFVNQDNTSLRFSNNNYQDTIHPFIHNMEVSYSPTSTGLSCTINGTEFNNFIQTNYGIGIRANEAIIPKKVANVEYTNSEANIVFADVVPTVSGVRMNSSLTDAYLEFTNIMLEDTLASANNKLYIQIYTDQECTTSVNNDYIEVTIDNLISNMIDGSNLEINRTYYYKLFVRNNENEYFAIYDVDENIQGKIYSFTTGQNDLDIEYEFIANNYNEKRLEVSINNINFRGEIDYFEYLIYMDTDRDGEIDEVSDVLVSRSGEQYSTPENYTNPDLKPNNIIHEINIDPDNFRRDSIDDTGSEYAFEYNKQYVLKVIAWQYVNITERNESILRGQAVTTINIPSRQDTQILPDNIFIQMNRAFNQDQGYGISIKYTLVDDYKCFIPGTDDKLASVELYEGEYQEGENPIYRGRETEYSGNVGNVFIPLRETGADIDTIPSGYSNPCTVRIILEADTNNDGTKDETYVYEQILGESINNGFGNIRAQFNNNGRITFVMKSADYSAVKDIHSIIYSLYDEDNRPISSTKTENITGISTLQNGDLALEVNPGLNNIDLRSIVRKIALTFKDVNNDALLISYQIDI